MSTLTQDRPLAGRTLYPHDVRGKLTDLELRELRSIGVLPVLAGGSPEAATTSQPDPFGVFVDSDGRVVVDDFTNPISNIPTIVRAFARANEGYWIEDVFTAPGWTVQGGAVRYSVSSPGDHFLPNGQTLRPRAPGAEAPRISGSRRRPVVAYPESVSASLEVTDEARQRNAVDDVQTTFRQAANTFAYTFQTLGELALAGLIALTGRELVVAGAGTYADWATAPRDRDVSSSDPRPADELAEVQLTFEEDKGGVLPDTLIWNPRDKRRFRRVYEKEAAAVLADFGITRTLTSIRQPEGTRTYLKSGQVGTMAWEKPVGDPEYTREGTRFTDVFTMEGRPVFVANGGDAILQVRKTA